MSTFQIKPATRSGVKPFIVLYGESGHGKTYSSLLLARGFVGPQGRIVMIDSESGRGSLYADVPEVAPYDVIELAEPFSPSRYVAAIEAVESSGASIGIVDSGSHEWEGVGGVLDLAAENEQRSGRAGLHNWKTPKFEHSKFVARLMRSSIPWIVCLRAKYKTRQGKDEKGKTCIIKDDHTSPIQAEDFIFEATAHGEIGQGHALHLTKWSHPSLKQCFPQDAPITTKHGEALSRWCNQAGTAAAQSPTPSQQSGATEKTRERMVELMQPIREKALSYAIDKGIIMPNEGLENWPLSKVPTSKQELNELFHQIEQHQ